MLIYWLFAIITLLKADRKQSQCPPAASSIEPLSDKILMYDAPIVVALSLASISKTFVAMVAMQRIEANRLDSGTDINRYLSPLLRIAHP